MGLSCSSDVKDSACNAGDLGSIPRSGRFPVEGNGNTLQYSSLENSMDRGAWWAIVHGTAKSQTQHSLGASLVVQMVKTLPVMQETWVQRLIWEDPLEKEMGTYSNILAWRIPWTEESSRLQSMVLQRVRHD